MALSVRPSIHGPRIFGLLVELKMMVNCSKYSFILWFPHLTEHEIIAFVLINTKPQLNSTEPLSCSSWATTTSIPSFSILTPSSPPQKSRYEFASTLTIDELTTNPESNDQPTTEWFQALHGRHGWRWI